MRRCSALCTSMSIRPEVIFISFRNADESIIHVQLVLSDVDEISCERFHHIAVLIAQMQNPSTCPVYLRSRVIFVISYATVNLYRTSAILYHGSSVYLINSHDKFARNPWPGATAASSGLTPI